MASKFLNSKNVDKTALLGLMLALAAGTTTTLAQSFQPAEEPMYADGSEQVDNAPASVSQSFVPPSTPVASESAPLDGESEVRVDDNMTVDLHVKDEDLANVLEMLSIQSQKNIIASKDVSARVTANLYGVTFYEALDAILNVNGYGFIEEGNFIKIYTLEELQKIQAANRVKISKVVNLNHMAAVDAAEFVKPLLSPEGQIKVNSKASAFASMSEVPIGGEDYANGSMLVVYDFEENVAQVEEMIRQIDTRPAQVLVEATILQTQLNDAVALGVDFSIVADMNFGQLATGPLGAVTGLLAPATASNQAPADGGGTAAVSTVGNVATGNGGLKIGILSNDVGVFIRALDEVTDTTVLSNPKIMALNRMSSRVLVGRKVGYLSTTATDTSTTQTVEFLDTGTSLYFRPFVTNDNMIRMELKPKVAEAAIRQVTDIGGSAVTIPDEITNEITTNIIVRDGQTVVLGGLFRESVTSTRKQVPLLGDIPFLGTAFKGKEDTTSRNEIIFLITPTILNDATITDSGSRAGEYVNTITAGARQGVLSFSRERLTNNLNLEADRLVREGNTEAALNKIERSLTLSPVQPELMHLREKITGEKRPGLNRSFLDRVINKEAAGSLLQVKAKDDLISSADPHAEPSWEVDNTQYDYMMPAQQTAQAQPEDQPEPTLEFHQDAGLSTYAQEAAAQPSDYQTASVESSAGPSDSWLEQQPESYAVTVPTSLAESFAPAYAPLTDDQIEAYFTSPHNGLWMGPTGFVRNITAWNQFMSRWNAENQSILTSVPTDGQ